MLSQCWYAGDPVTAALTRPPLGFTPGPRGDSGGPLFPFSRETSEHLAVPKGAPRELQRDLSQGDKGERLHTDKGQV